MQIVTGFTGANHITSNDDQGRNQGIFGTGSYVLPVRSQFAATIVSANEIQIADGEGVMQGVHFRIEPTASDVVTINNGTQGMQRRDLIVARYERASETGVESVSLAVLTGTPAASNPVTPTPTGGDILEGSALAEMPLYRVTLNGVSITAVDPLFTVADSLETANESIMTLENKLNGIGDDGVRFFKSQIGANNSLTITSSEATRYVVIVNGAVAAAKSINVVDVNSSGTIHQAQALTGTNVTYSTATNRLTVNNSSTYGAFILVMQYHGADITIA